MPLAPSLTWRRRRRRPCSPHCPCGGAGPCCCWPLESSPSSNDRLWISGEVEVDTRTRKIRIYSSFSDTGHQLYHACYEICLLMWLLFPSQDWRQRSPKRETYLYCVQAFEMHLRLTDGVSDCDCTTVSAWQSVLVSGDQYLLHIYISIFYFL